MLKMAASGAAGVVLGSGLVESAGNSPVNSPKLGRHHMKNGVESLGNSPVNSPKLGLRKAIDSVGNSPVGSPRLNPKHGLLKLNTVISMDNQPSHGPHQGSETLVTNQMEQTPDWKKGTQGDAGQQCFVGKKQPQNW